MIDQDRTHVCNKTCIANVNGRCAVQICGGPIVRISRGYQDPEAAAWAYEMARASFADYFGEGYIDDDDKD